MINCEVHWSLGLQMHQIWSLTRTVVNMNKAFTQHFHARDRIKVTAEEAQN